MVSLARIELKFDYGNGRNRFIIDERNKSMANILYNGE